MPIVAPVEIQFESLTKGEPTRTKIVNLLEGPTLDECRRAEKDGERLMLKVLFPGWPTDNPTEIPLFVDSVDEGWSYSTVCGRTGKLDQRHAMAVDFSYRGDVPCEFRYLRYLNQ